MSGASPGEIFTAEDAWSGGHYETSFFYPAGSDADAALSALWSFSALAGPVGSRKEEPWEQPGVEPTARQGELDGVVTLPGGALAACATFVFGVDDYDEVTFALPLGSLSIAWPEVRGFPFGVTTAEVEAWEPRLESLLFALAQHLHARAPFLRGLTGFEGIEWALDGASLRDPGPVPASHGAGIIDVQDGEVVWHPPTTRGGFVANDGDPLAL
jgi:hypothetical protein